MQWHMLRTWPAIHAARGRFSLGWLARKPLIARSAATAILGASLTLAPPGSFAAADGPYVSEVVSYDPGSPRPMLTDPQVVLGEPSRWTGEPIFPAVVSPFNPPWTDNEIVSIGPGGHLTVRFESPVLHDPDRLYGIDFLVFGNTGFIDSHWPSGVVGGFLGDLAGVIEVSADGETWHTIPDVDANGMYPTLGYSDVGPYSEKHGRVATDFRRPVDPALTINDLLGLDYTQLYDLYHGSGGGAGVNLDTVGLSEATYIRITNPADSGTVQIDGIAKTAAWIPGDLNFDGIVNVFDLILLINEWGAKSPGGVPADLNGDGVVDVFDLIILINNWGA